MEITETKLSAREALELGGVDTAAAGVLQVGKIHTDLAFALVCGEGAIGALHEVVTVKVLSHRLRRTGSARSVAFGGGHGLRRARGWIAAAKRGEHQGH